MDRRWIMGGGLVLLALVPLLPLGQYPFHMLVLILLYSLVGTAWALMGRFGLVSFGHSAFMGAAVYTSALLWNYFRLTPWIGMPAGIAVSLALAFVVGYPCFRLQVVGHYFGLLTLALGEVVRLLIIAMRDVTGGSLGMTPNRVRDADVSWSALQFADKRYFYYIALALWVLGLYIWNRVDRSKLRNALEAISEDEVAAASIGIHVTSAKMRITLLSAGLAALGGIFIGQYNMYLSPEYASIGLSLQIVFASIVGGMYSLLGPTVGAALTLALAESLRNFFGTKFVGAPEIVFGLLLILFIIFMPNGIYGALEARLKKRGTPSAPAAPTQAAPTRSV
ncbi:MAG TPA: branched-chain amino acid ABC transporter permease [bacterium]